MYLTKLILFAKRYNVDSMSLNLIRLFPTIEKLGLNEIDMKKFQNILTHEYLPLLSKLEIPNNYSTLNVYEDKKNTQINQNVDCLLPWFYMLISADGSVYPCCKFVGSNKEMDFRKSIKESWKNSNFLKMFRDNYLQEKIPYVCSISCRSSYKKMWLEQANNLLRDK
jgi:radical SAM protein with 4Fe4S-binding SPASM domain